MKTIFLTIVLSLVGCGGDDGPSEASRQQACRDHCLDIAEACSDQCVAYVGSEYHDPCLAHCADHADACCGLCGGHDGCFSP